MVNLDFWKMIDFVATIILARILTPEDFGVVSIALTFILLLMMFPGFGMGYALIQMKKNVKKAADTVFVFAPLAALGIIGIMFVLSPLIAAFYEAPALSGMLRLLSIAVLFSALGLVPAALFEKNLQYRKKIIPEIVAPIVMSIVSVVLALRGYGAWSIVWGYFALYVCSAFLTWLVTDYRPSFRYDTELVKEMMGFGKDVVLIYILGFLISYASYGVIGKVLGIAIAGFFSVANKFATLVMKNITKLVNRVSFPVFSAIQEDLDKLRVNFVKIVEYTAFLVIPSNVGIFVLAPEIIEILYGEKWLPSVPILRILCFMGVFFAMTIVTHSVFFSLNKHHLLKRIQALQLAIILIFILPASYFGISEVAILISFSYFVTMVLSYLAIRRILKLNLKLMLRDFLYIPVSAILMAVFVGLLRELIDPGAFMLVFIIGLGFLFYLVMVFILNKRFYKKLIRQVFNYFEN